MPRVTCQLKCEQPSASDKLSNPPYKISNMGYENYKGDAPLQMKSISPTARECGFFLDLAANAFWTSTVALRSGELACQCSGHWQRMQRFLLTFDGRRTITVSEDCASNPPACAL